MTQETPTERYETLFSRLQVIVSQLETGDAPLEESLLLYEEGVVIAAACQRLLDTATLTVQRLQNGMSLDE